MSLLDKDNGTTAEGVMPTLRCANKDCNNVLAQFHFLGAGVLRVFCCPRCHRGSEFESTPRGIACRMLPKGARTPSQEQPPKAAKVVLNGGR